jgi:serine/threonine protein kinase
MDRYEFIAEISRNQVYKVRDRQTGSILALKRDRGGVDHEAGVLHAIGNHENIVSLHNIIDRTIMVLDYCEFDLTGVITHLHLTKRQLIGMMLHILHGVEFIHLKGFVHSDIKPDNILVNKEGIAKITDFGSSSPIADSRKSPEIGAIECRAPEILMCEDDTFVYTPATDIWALGCVFFFMMTGHELFTQTVQRATPEGDEYWFLRDVMRTRGRTSLTVPSDNLGMHLDQTLPPEFIDAKQLLLKMLWWNPKSRITANQALTDRFWAGERYIPTGITIDEVHHETVQRQAPQDWGQRSFSQLIEDRPPFRMP